MSLIEFLEVGAVANLMAYFEVQVPEWMKYGLNALLVDLILKEEQEVEYEIESNRPRNWAINVRIL